MNTESKILLLALIIIVIIIPVGYLLTPEPVDDTPRVGDIWEHYGTGDPFKKDEIYVRRIIGVNKGYIQYIVNDRDTMSRPINVFKYNSEKISSNTKKKDS